MQIQFALFHDTGEYTKHAAVCQMAAVRHVIKVCTMGSKMFFAILNTSFVSTSTGNYVISVN